MAKTRISSTDLAWISQEKLNAFDSCPPAVSIAIVPTGEDGWAAVTTARVRAVYPLCARRIEQIQKQISRTGSWLTMLCDKLPNRQPRNLVPALRSRPPLKPKVG